MEKFDRLHGRCFESHEDQAILANRSEIGNVGVVIPKPPSNRIPSRNPYRAILRREYPEPLIALLAFLLGIWLWDHYFGKSEGYAPGTEEIALVKIDRDLRLSDEMADDPRWLLWLTGVEEPVMARREAMHALEKLSVDKSISMAGLEAYAIIKATQGGLPLREVLSSVLQGRNISDFTETSEELAHHHGTWWHAKLIANWEKSLPPASHWREVFTLDSKQLRTRAIVARTGIWLLGLVGLLFIPVTLRDMKHGLRARPRGYGGAWTLPLGLIVFLVATLAWIGFTMTLELGIDALPNLPPALGLFLDSAARLLPSLIAIGLLFRRPSHAIRVLGLTRSLAVKNILGWFSLLMMVDQVLRVTLGHYATADPGGGLSPSEAGLWGLAFTLASACLLAPLAEELLYRGVLFRALWNRLGVIPAALLSAVVFAVLHFYNGYGLASVGVFGFSCALLYAATGSLTSTIALHILYNSAIKIPEWLIYHGPLG